MKLAQINKQALKPINADVAAADQAVGLERGAAEVKVTLKNGVITVRATDGKILLKGEAQDGTWNGMWAALRNGISSK